MRVKRIFDFILASLCLFISLPLFIIILLSIKINSKGKVLHSSERIGLNGKKFKILKFRTLYQNFEREDYFSIPTNDPNVTRIGRVLRRYHLNELPQSINIIKGDMSFVGPRPEVEHYTKKLRKGEKEILSVKPGLTDFASIKFINESEILEKSIYKDKNLAYEKLIRPEKIRLQLKYVKEQTFWLDIKLILKTGVVLLKCKTPIQV